MEFEIFFECNNCDWVGKESECVQCGAIRPLCPECHETTQVIKRIKKPQTRKEK